MTVSARSRGKMNHWRFRRLLGDVCNAVGGAWNLERCTGLPTGKAENFHERLDNYPYYLGHRASRRVQRDRWRALFRHPLLRRWRLGPGDHYSSGAPFNGPTVTAFNLPNLFPIRWPKVTAPSPQRR